MPGSYRPNRPIRAEILPLLSSPSDPRPHDGQKAKASSSLWSAILRVRKGQGEFARESAVALAVDWPEDRRLGKGKERSLIIWVDRLEENITNDDANILYIHPSLLPPFTITPVSAKLHVHEPFELTLAILQPVIEYEDDTIPSQDHVDLSPLYAPSSSSSSSSTSQSNTASYNNHPPIIRQGGILPLQQHRFKVLLLEPVKQGLLTSSTRVIISTKPHILSHADVYDAADAEEDGLDGAGSIAKTSMSLSDFDPDTFLSTNLSLSLSLPGDTQTEDDGMTASISSSTSGSLTPRPGDRPLSPPIGLDELVTEEVERGTRFTAVQASGINEQRNEEGEDVCWMGVGGLGRAGIFEGDWVLLRFAGEGESSGSSSSSSSSTSTKGRLVKALAWERLDEYDDDLPSNPILLPPSIYRALGLSSSTNALTVQPTPFGARQPTLPTAKTVSLARIATAEGVDKRYERAWLKGLKSHFSSGSKRKGKSKALEGGGQLIRSGDIISILVFPSKPMSSDENIDDEDNSDSENESDSLSPSPKTQPKSIGVVYFTITSICYDPLVPLEEDFRSSFSSKARAGELGCWIDTDGGTKMVLTGVETDRIQHREGDLVWYGIDASPKPFAMEAHTKLRDLLRTAFVHPTLSSLMQLSILVKGARGSGKRSLIRYIAEELGYNINTVECYDVIGDTSATPQGMLEARIEKAKLCAPSLLLLHNIEALAKKTESTVLGRPPPIVKILEDIVGSAKQSKDWPVIVVGTTVDADSVPNEVLGVFKQDIEISAPNENERLVILQNILEEYHISPDIDLKIIARQTAALHAGDIRSLILRANDLSLNRISAMDADKSFHSIDSARLAGIQITAQDLNEAINQARSSYSDSIGAPKIPNVTWDDVGGLVHIKKDILDTVQLPLERGDLFGEGLKKRSGILLYGPPGTGKTLLAKAVATSCSLNFFSVKGPELLNMYIGESEANVRRVFQRARDASPCVIFMDELDSIAPKRGNQGDSGGVMDRIVSQLLAELDGMSGSSGKGKDSQVFVLGATNRPDLLDSSLLRPGRFDKMLYLNIPATNKEQLDILKSLTRKFTLDESLLLEDVVERLSSNYTGADLYALCSDAILGAMIRLSNNIDEKVKRINEIGNANNDDDDENGSLDAQEVKGKDQKKKKEKEISTQYYLSKMATKEETQVKVTFEDFEKALEKLKPSVSEDELRHYERVQREFKNYNIGNKDKDTDMKVVEAPDRGTYGNGDELSGSMIRLNGENGRDASMKKANGHRSKRDEGEQNGFGYHVVEDGHEDDENNPGKAIEHADDGVDEREEYLGRGKGKAKEVDGYEGGVDRKGNGKGKARQVDGY
uniref:Peroxisomal ATPase PEX6 n=1 Tax=Kwoniella dejecticola CBS 10117 TaxID=1296121 RepID=A0A1A5ZYM0_9TREE|nr:uncharacterized protein I303_06463 [Kwoniella dejecticola CBS 10117]OBR82905.1 hypothetical protein I303_06463 [Kwoniella dejecticola CBS 10117]